MATEEVTSHLLASCTALSSWVQQAGSLRVLIKCHELELLLLVEKVKTSWLVSSL